MYNFRIVDNGVDKASSMLKQKDSRRLSLSTSTQSPSHGHRRRTSSQIQSQQLKGSEVPSLVNGNRLRSDQAMTTLAGLKSPENEHSPPQKPLKATPSKVNGMDDLELCMSALKFLPTSIVTKRPQEKR